MGWAKKLEQDLEITAEGISKEVKYIMDLERDSHIIRADETPAINAQIAHTIWIFVQILKISVNIPNCHNFWYAQMAENWIPEIIWMPESVQGTTSSPSLEV